MNKHIFNKSCYMKLKFEIFSAYLSQCIATLHCFLYSKSLKNNSENCSQLWTWKSKKQYTKNTRISIKTEKTEKNLWTFGALINMKICYKTEQNLPSLQFPVFNFLFLFSRWINKDKIIFIWLSFYSTIWGLTYLLLSLIVSRYKTKTILSDTYRKACML